MSKATQPERHFYPAGDIERGDGKGSYRWVPGYAEVRPTGAIVYPWSTRREVQDEVRREGAKAIFHPSKEAALAAAKASAGAQVHGRSRR